MVVLERFAYRDKYVIGRLYIGNIFFCHTLEPQLGASVSSKGCIPAGVYKMAMSWSPKFQKMLPILFDVPNFEGIRIHPGNSSKDTQGCILLGDNSSLGLVLNSASRVNEFIRLFQKNKLQMDMLHIINK
jgi:hypothetical protein